MHVQLLLLRSRDGGKHNDDGDIAVVGIGAVGTVVTGRAAAVVAAAPSSSLLDPAALVVVVVVVFWGGGCTMIGGGETEAVALLLLGSSMAWNTGTSCTPANRTNATESTTSTLAGAFVVVAITIIGEQTAKK